MDNDLSLVQRETRQAQAVMRDAHFRPTDVALVILTSLAVLYTLYFAASIILPFVLALVLSLLLGPAARFLCDRLRLPRMLAAVLLIGVLFTGIGSVGYAISVPAAGWIAKAPQSLPTLQKKLSFLRQPIEMFENGMTQMQKLMQDSGSGQTSLTETQSFPGPVAPAIAAPAPPVPSGHHAETARPAAARTAGTADGRCRSGCARHLPAGIR